MTFYLSLVSTIDIIYIYMPYSKSIKVHIPNYKVNTDGQPDNHDYYLSYNICNIIENGK